MAFHSPDRKHSPSEAMAHKGNHEIKVDSQAASKEKKDEEHNPTHDYVP